MQISTIIHLAAYSCFAICRATHNYTTIFLTSLCGLAVEFSICTVCPPRFLVSVEPSTHCNYICLPCFKLIWNGCSLRPFRGKAHSDWVSIAVTIAMGNALTFDWPLISFWNYIYSAGIQVVAIGIVQSYDSSLIFGILLQKFSN